MTCLTSSEILIANILKGIGGKIISVRDATGKLTQIAQLILSGGVIALPTDTIYGVACSVTCSSAFSRVRQLKGRAPEKPMAICLDQVAHISEWCDTMGLPDGLLSDLLPGPVTVLLPRRGLPVVDRLSHLNPGVALVGVRIPKFGFIRDLVSALSEANQAKSTPLVLTSANLSGATSALNIHDFACLWPSLDLVVDGGVIEHNDLHNLGLNARAGSTIVDLCQVPTACTYSIVRDGSALTQTIRILEAGYGLRRVPQSDRALAYTESKSIH